MAHRAQACQLRGALGLMRAAPLSLQLLLITSMSCHLHPSHTAAATLKVVGTPTALHYNNGLANLEPAAQPVGGVLTATCHNASDCTAELQARPTAIPRLSPCGAHS